MQGLFVTLEATEGAGKGTSRGFLDDCFKAAGRATTLTREPGGTPLAEQIRELLLSPRDETMCTNTELLLMFGSRMQHVEQVILPWMARGSVVLCERFTDSTYAYQHYARGLSKELIDGLVALFKPPVPDYTFILDIDPEIGMRRASARGQLDRIEQETMDFFHRARNGFLTRAKEDTSGRFRIVDATPPIPEVRKQYLDHLLNDNLITPEAVALVREKYDVA